MRYVQYFQGTKECMGSGSVFILDGRNKLPTMVKDAIVRAEKLSFSRPNYSAFEIRKKAGYNPFLAYKVLYRGNLKKVGDK